jgi:hypothetical protein
MEKERTEYSEIVRGWEEILTTEWVGYWNLGQFQGEEVGIWVHGFWHMQGGNLRMEAREGYLTRVIGYLIERKGSTMVKEITREVRKFMKIGC